MLEATSSLIDNMTKVSIHLTNSGLITGTLNPKTNFQQIFPYVSYNTLTYIHYKRKVSNFYPISHLSFISFIIRKKKYSKLLYLSHTLCQNIRFKIQVLTESYYEFNFSFCIFIFCEAEGTAFVARTVITFLNKQNSFSDRFIACLSQKYLLQWTS